MLANGNLLVGTDGTNQSEVLQWNGTQWSQIGAAFLGYGPLTPPNTSRPSVISALAVLPNGDLLAGGGFSIGVAGNLQNFARWDGATWNPLPAPVGGVLALHVEPNGEILLGGIFAASGSSAPAVWQWDGATTTQVGAAPTGYALFLQPLPNGQLLIGGSLQTGTASLMLWNGTT